MSKTNGDGQTFGSWLLAQNGRSGPVGKLIEGAKINRAFPRYGTPEEVRSHLSLAKADSGLLAAVDEAEIDWLKY